MSFGRWWGAVKERIGDLRRTQVSRTDVCSDGLAVLLSCSPSGVLCAWTRRERRCDDRPDDRESWKSSLDACVWRDRERPREKPAK